MVDWTQVFADWGLSDWTIKANTSKFLEPVYGKKGKICLLRDSPASSCRSRSQVRQAYKPRSTENSRSSITPTAPPSKGISKVPLGKVKEGFKIQCERQSDKVSFRSGL